MELLELRFKTGAVALIKASKGDTLIQRIIESKISQS